MTSMASRSALIGAAIGPKVMRARLAANPGQASMMKPLAILIFVAAAVALAGVGHTQAVAPKSDDPGQVKATMIRPVIDISDPHAFTRIANPYASAAPDAGVARTSVDHRFAPEGPYGSLGFVCDNDNHPPAPQETGVLAGSQAGRLVGGTLRLPF